MNNNIFHFIGGNKGTWEIISQNTVVGSPLQKISRLEILPVTQANLYDNSIWVIKGLVSNLRYTEKEEKESLKAIQPDLGRSGASCAALIPIRKNAAWWELAQNERRAIFEQQSEHIRKGMKYLPAIARKLYHSRDIGEDFDFLTWFEYAPQDSEAFEELVSLLRETQEWSYVEREIDFRLKRE